MNCGTMTEPGFAEVTEDMILGGQLRLRQPKRGHRAGHDAILLAAAAPARTGFRVVEFGAGVGTAGLALARRVSGLDLVLAEIDESLAALARVNAAANDISAQVLTFDVTANADAFATVGLTPDSADIILMNPPFNDADRHRASPDPARQSAHVAAADTLERWTHAARRVLKSGGVLTLIWRADGLPQVLAVLERGFGGPPQSDRCSDPCDRLGGQRWTGADGAASRIGPAGPGWRRGIGSGCRARREGCAGAGRPVRAA